MYEELVAALNAADKRPCSNMECPGYGECPDVGCLFREAADAIEELNRLRVAAEENRMHWQDMAVKFECDLHDAEGKIPKWVSVEERLPAEPGEYVVYIRESLDNTRKRENKELEPWEDYDLSYVYFAFFDIDQMVWNIGNTYYNAVLSVVNREKDSHITHWMPLPTPPKEAPNGTDS